MKCLVLSRQQMYLKGSVLLGQIPQSILLVTSYHRTCWLHSELLFTRSVMSDTLWPHGLQYTRLPCPSPTPGACLNSCPSSQWYHPTISSSVVPFSFCLQSFPASGSFPMSRLVNLNYSLTEAISKSVTLGIKISTYEYCEGATI